MEIKNLKINVTAGVAIDTAPDVKGAKADVALAFEMEELTVSSEEVNLIDTIRSAVTDSLRNQLECRKMTEERRKEELHINHMNK